MWAPVLHGERAISDFRQMGARDNQLQTVSRAQTATSGQTGNKMDVYINMAAHYCVALDIWAQPVRTSHAPANGASEDKSKRLSDDACDADRK